MNRNELGQTLLELMLALTLGTVVLSQSLHFFSKKLSTQADHAAQTRLTEELRGVSQLIGADLRRAGYWNSATDIRNNPHAWLDVTSDCVILSYDANHDGAVTAASNEIFAYRARDGKIQSRQSASDCTSGRWENVTDPDFLTIDRFDIRSEPVRDVCVNLSDENFSSCNAYDCNYQPYNVGDILIVKPAITIELSAFTNRGKFRHALADTVALQNVISITADHHGPTHTLAGGCQ